MAEETRINLTSDPNPQYNQPNQLNQPNHLNQPNQLSKPYKPKLCLDVEIDRECHAQLLCQAVRGNDNKVAVVPYRDAPVFLKHNHYVRHGYRDALPFSACILSLFTWTNESVNIWSHLLGFIVFFLLTIYDNLVVLPELGLDSAVDRAVITVGLLCYQFCMLSSTGYHVFNCHSERASRRWLMVDIAGICIGLIGCYIPSVHFAFYCTSIWRDLYLLFVSILSLTVLFVQLSPRYMSHHPHKYWNHRIVLFIALVAYGIIPVCHWIRLNGGFHSPLVQIFAPKVFVMYAMGFLALIFYLTRLPERCFPGKFDYLGSSHQWWHIIVVLAFLYWHNAAFEFLKYRAGRQCTGDGT